MKLAVALAFVALVLALLFVVTRDRSLSVQPTPKVEAPSIRDKLSNDEIAPLETPSVEPSSTRVVAPPIESAGSSADARRTEDDDASQIGFAPRSDETWLEGNVRDARGQPVSGATVVMAITTLPVRKFADGSGASSAYIVGGGYESGAGYTTDETGHFYAEFVDDGLEEYGYQDLGRVAAKLFVFACGHEDYERDVVLDIHRSRAGVRVTLVDAQPDVLGTVLDARGRRVAGARVLATQANLHLFDAAIDRANPSNGEPTPLGSQRANALERAAFEDPWSSASIRKRVKEIVAVGDEMAGDTQLATSTDAKGVFRIPCARADRVLSLDVTADGQPPLHVTRDELDGKWRDVRLKFAKGTTVRGRVLDEHAVAIAKVRVQAGRADELHWFPATSITDANGRYELDSLPSGEVMIEVWREPLEDGRWRPWAGVIVSLGEGETRETDVVLGASPSFPSTVAGR